jgi:hypothetical protein
MASEISLQDFQPDRPWGIIPLTGSSAAAKQVIGNAVVGSFDYASWYLIERTDIVDEWLMGSEYLPKVLFAVFPLTKSDGFDALQAEASLYREILTISLRLSGFDSFVEPELICTYIRDGWTNIRTPGYYRQAMYSKAFSGLSALEENTARMADELFPRVAIWLDNAANVELLSMHLFRQSFGPFLRPGDRLLFLFAALETLLFGWRHEVSKTDLIGRARKAALAIGITLPQEVDAHQLRNARNALAHGELDQSKFDAMVPSLRMLSRGVLLAWIRFSLTADGSGSPRQDFNERLAISANLNEQDAETRQRLYSDSVSWF